MVGGPVQHFKDAVLDAWRDLNSADLCRRKVFRGGPLLDFRGSMQLLFSSHVRDRDKALLRGILSGVFGMVFSLARCKGITFHVASVEDLMGMVICAGNVPIPLWLLFGVALNFTGLLVWIKLVGLGAFHGMVGYRLCLAMILGILGLVMWRMLLPSGWNLLLVPM